MRTREWTDADKDRAADLATSYVDGFARAAREFDIEPEELDAVLLDQNVEKCPSCGWYVDSRDLIPHDHDDPDGHCPNCR